MSRLLKRTPSYRIEDHGIPNNISFLRIEAEFNEARGDGQFVVLAEGVTWDDESDWPDDRAGHTLTIAADDYDSLQQAYAWLRDEYCLFTVHVETEEPRENP